MEFEGYTPEDEQIPEQTGVEHIIFYAPQTESRARGNGADSSQSRFSYLATDAPYVPIEGQPLIERMSRLQVFNSAPLPEEIDSSTYQLRSLLRSQGKAV